MFVCISYSEGHIGLERKVTKLEAMVKMLQEDLKKVLEGLKTRDLSKYSHSSAVHRAHSYSLFFLFWFRTSPPCGKINLQAHFHLFDLTFGLACQVFNASL